MNPFLVLIFFLSTIPFAFSNNAPKTLNQSVAELRHVLKDYPGMVKVDSSDIFQEIRVYVSTKESKWAINTRYILGFEGYPVLAMLGCPSSLIKETEEMNQSPRIPAEKLTFPTRKTLAQDQVNGGWNANRQFLLLIADTGWADIRTIMENDPEVIIDLIKYPDPKGISTLVEVTAKFKTLGALMTLLKHQTVGRVLHLD